MFLIKISIFMLILNCFPNALLSQFDTELNHWKSFREWNPFLREKYKINSRQLANNKTAKNITDDKRKPQETQIPDDILDHNFTDVPRKYRRHCVNLPSPNRVYGAGDVKSGRYYVMFSDATACIEKSSIGSNHHPFVQWIKDPDPRWPNSNVATAFLFGTSETHILSFNVICTFVEDHRIKCGEKGKIFKGLKNIEPISAFSVRDSSEKNRWNLIVDTKENVGDTSFIVRHVLQDGIRELKNFTLKYEANAATIYLRTDNYVEGYSFVKDSYYKFLFLTNKEIDEKSEIMRMLWGSTQEFLGCPKTLCYTSVVDTIVRLSDNQTYVFAGKHYWILENGLSVSRANYLDTESAHSSYFPYLVTHVDSSFFDIIDDTVYFFKGDYVYSYIGVKKMGTKNSAINGENINTVFRGIPSGMNAAFYYRPNATVYFFGNFQYWAYDMRAKTAIRGYPRPITDFKGLPPSIDAAMSDNKGNYYFFSGTFFSHFTEKQFADQNNNYKFVVSNLDFFKCPSKTFANYLKFKHDMENNFAPVSAEIISTQLQLKPSQLPAGQTERKNAPIVHIESFLNLFANLMLFGPFLYQPFLPRNEN